MPTETKSRRAVLSAIEGVEAIAELASRQGDHYVHELDLEVSVYGRNYNGKRVGPYIKLLTYQPGEDVVKEGDWGGNCFYILVDGKADVFIQTAGGEKKVSELKAGVQFGEMSVLAGVPRAATVRAPLDGETRVLEVQRPALRLLRKMETFSQKLDATYRLNGRKATLQDLAEGTEPSPELYKHLESISEFRVFSKNHTLYHQGEPITRVFVLRTGWVHLTKGSPMTEERYLGPIHCLGIEGIRRDGVWSETCTLLGRAEVLEISISRLRQSSEFSERAEQILVGTSGLLPGLTQKTALPVIQSQQRLIETGLVDGTNLLLMDMELCVRCGNCSLACHKVHGQSRLVRRGIHVERPTSIAKPTKPQNLLSPSVCMHCQDPECLTGCPTGAIQRLAGGQVDIDPKTCIGCGDCATQCPYNAISMVPRKAAAAGTATWRDFWSLAPAPLPPAVDQTDDLLAVKCNLCAGTALNPAGASEPAYSCEENCPTGALLRVNPHIYFKEVRNIENLISRDSTHGIARRVSHRDLGKQAMHAAGLLLTLLLTGLALGGIWGYGMETPLVSTWLNMRWFTGFVGLVGIAGVMAYPVRRQIYRRRAGPLKYWLLLHAYLGVIAGVILLIHGGSRSGGLLTTSLMIAFDLVIATGIFGIATYYFIPRLLTRIEEQPLLIEDLIARRTELKDEIAAETSRLSEPARSILQSHVTPKLFSLGYLLRQYLQRMSLDTQIAQSVSILQQHSSGLTSIDQEKLAVITGEMTILRRVEGLAYLHRGLKAWLLPHVLTTSVMLALMVVHIIQVVYFVAR
ncbi:MAG: cyclic nucleotide-binding domain-containing protein [Acidobacteriota bacterium]